MICKKCGKEFKLKEKGKKRGIKICVWCLLKDFIEKGSVRKEKEGS